MSVPAAILSPRTPEEVAALVGGAGALPADRGRDQAGPVRPATPGATAISLRGLTGIVEYDPGEFTFTALAGTPLSEIEAALARHGQYLPFDPLGAGAGATLPWAARSPSG